MARFMRKGTTRFYFVPTIGSATLAPTAAEVTAGTRLDTQLATIQGFTFSNSPIQTPDMATTFVSQIGGEDAAEDSSLDFYEDKTSNPISTALAKGTAGYVVIFPRGVAGSVPAAADKCDVWPVTVTSNSKQFTADNAAGMYQVKFATTAEPGFEKTVVA